MIDENVMRSQLAEFKSRLARLDDERTAILDIIKGYETLLRATAAPDHASSGAITFPPSHQAIVAGKQRSMPVGSVSMRSAVSQVMEAAGGTSLHTREVMSRAQALGAKTNAKVPLSVVDLILLNLSRKGRVERIAPRTWRSVPAPARRAE